MGSVSVPVSMSESIAKEKSSALLQFEGSNIISKQPLTMTSPSIVLTSGTTLVLNSVVPPRTTAGTIMVVPV